MKRSQLYSNIIKIMLGLFVLSILVVCILHFGFHIENTGVYNYLGITAITGIVGAIIFLILTVKENDKEHTEEIQEKNAELQISSWGKLSCTGFQISEEERNSNPFYYGHNRIIEDYEVKGKTNEIQYTLRKLQIGDRERDKYHDDGYDRYTRQFKGSHILWNTGKENNETDIVIMSKKFLEVTGYHLHVKNIKTNKDIYGYVKRDSSSEKKIIFTKGNVTDKDMEVAEYIYNIARNLYKQPDIKERILYGFEPAIRYTGKTAELLLWEAGTENYNIEQRIEDVEKFLDMI